jgi:hypothetical protein
MDFIKKHYEKILLGVVLVGLAVAVVFLQFLVSSEQSKLNELTSNVLNPRVKPLTNIDLTMLDSSLKRMATPATIDFGPPNRLFNPMPWQKGVDGHIIPSQKVGPTAVTVTNIVPLYLRLTLDSVNTSDSGPKYVIGIEKQAAVIPSQRTKKQTYSSLNPPSKNDTFTMVDVKGKPDEPSQIIVQLNDTTERAIITKDKPFSRVDGYMADLRYDPEKKNWPDKRVGAVLPFNGEDYKIVAINASEVVLSAPNQKKWTIRYSQQAATATP